MIPHKIWSLGAGLVVLSASSVAAEPSGAPVQAFAAQVEQAVLAPDGRQTSLTSFTVLLAETRARVMYEVAAGERAGYAEYHVYDFGSKRLYRVFPDDRIYFEVTLSPALAAKTHLEGWGPPPADLRVRTIPLKDDTVAGSAATLSLLERRRRGRAPEYALVWTAVPPGRFPLRVVYVQDGGQTVVLAYRSAESREVDASEVAVPDTFVNLSPF